MESRRAFISRAVAAGAVLFGSSGAALGCRFGRGRRDCVMPSYFISEPLGGEPHPAQPAFERGVDLGGEWANPVSPLSTGSETISVNAGLNLPWPPIGSFTLYLRRMNQ